MLVKEVLALFTGTSFFEQGQSMSHLNALTILIISTHALGFSQDSIPEFAPAPF